MAINIIDNIIGAILPSYLYDQVAVFDQNFNQVFKTARPIKAVIKEQSKVMEHPVETGITIVDHRIILPVEIELSLITNGNKTFFSTDYQTAYNQIRSFYYDATLLTVQTRSGIYTNQLIQSLPHEEDPSIYDELTIALSLKQVQFVMPQYGTAPKNPSNSNTVPRGQQQPMTANSMQSSVFGDIWDGITSYTKGWF